MNICVFCSSNDLEEKYLYPAKELATMLAESGHTIVYGGSDYGLMKVLADTVQLCKGKIVGITTSVYSRFARKNADEMIFTETLNERKALLLKRSDVVVVMVGGLGTLDEMTEILELKKQSQHNKKIIILNTDGFYDGLKMQLQRMSKEGFLRMGEQISKQQKTLDQFVQFVSEPNEVIRLIANIEKIPLEVEPL